MKKYVILLVILSFMAFNANAQFRIKIPKIKKPKTEKTKQTSNKKTQENNKKEVENSVQPVSNNVLARQMVMDDAYTFFDAEPVEEYDSQIRLRKDIGWYLKSNLRMLGTFPSRSAFKVVVKRNGKELSTIRCEGNIYTKADDPSLRTPLQRKGHDLNFEDYMYSSRCFDKESAIKATGKVDVEVYFIDGDTDEEKLVRTYKIDVHRAPRVRGSASKPQPDVAHYYIQRHPEAAAAFIHVTGSHTGTDRSSGRSYFLNYPATSGTPTYGSLIAYISYAPERSRKPILKPYVRCSVDGQRVKLPRDGVSMSNVNKIQEYAVYTDRNAPKYKRGSAYRDDVKFNVLAVQLPLYMGTAEYRQNPFNIEEYSGKWECTVMSNGVKYRTLRWEVGSDGQIVPHAEQKNGNVNLLYKTYLVDVEIPEGGSPMDYRLMPMPNAGFFYGIPWTSAEGKAAAARVPKKGNPFHVPSNKAN